MSTSYSLFKNVLRKSIIDSIYNGVISKTERYYHWLGKENKWSDFLSPFIPSSLSDVPGPPQNNFRYDLHVRRDFLTVKAITSSDVSYVIPRINWESGKVYDMYDDAYTEPITQAIPWQSSITVTTEQIIKFNSLYYIALSGGTLGTSAPTHTVGTVTNGNVPLRYMTRDVFAASGATTLESSKFYVLTSEFNVYKCIWNNNDNPSTVMPTTTPSDLLVTTADNYKWKFMYTIPVSLRNRFLSSEWMPVTTALKKGFYSDGEITDFIIENPGSGYLDTDIILVSGDGYLPDNPYVVKDINIVHGGLGYASAPSITFEDPALTGSAAEGTVTINGSGVVTAKTLSSPGFGYDTNPDIVVDEPKTLYTLWTPGTNVTLGSIIKWSVTIVVSEISYTQDIYYEVTTAGQLAGSSNQAPSHETGVQQNGTAYLTVVARRAVLTSVVEKSEAELTPIVVGGQITGIIIDKGGIGYTNANIQIFAAGGGASTGTGAVITANFNKGLILSLQADVELDAVPGSIETIKVVDKGTGYGAASVEVRGDGTGATAVAVTASGEIVEIIVTNPGIGYTWTDIIITGSGTGATARAIMSPINGHGSNAIDELNANSLMFYSSISRDKNQGLEINNDYRKAGLVKNLKAFGTGLIFKEDTGSGCVLIEGTFDPLKISYDVLLQKDGYKNYRVVEYTNTKILLSVFNNFTINVGDSLTVMEGDNAGYSFPVTKVTERTIDQFSGDLLFLTVREPYSPTAEQIVTLRTVVTI